MSLARRRVSHVQLTGLDIQIPPDHGGLHNDKDTRGAPTASGYADDSIEKTVVIDTLETALPAVTKPDPYELLPRLVDLQLVIAPLLFGSEEDRRRIEIDPLYTKVMNQLAEAAKRWNTT